MPSGVVGCSPNPHPASRIVIGMFRLRTTPSLPRRRAGPPPSQTEAAPAVVAIGPASRLHSRMHLDWPGLILLLVGLLAVSCDTGGGFGDSGFVGGFHTGSGCDTGAEGEELLYADVDGDGYGDEDAALMACQAPEDFVKNHADCDDGDPTVRPDAEEVCGDGVDQDCDGVDASCEG